jgi:subtilase family serine protease
VTMKLRPARAVAFAVLGLAITAFTAALTSSSPAAAAPVGQPGFVAMADSVSPTTDAVTGGYSSASMPIEVALAPRDQAGLTSLLDGLYTQGSSTYHHWLAPGAFDARYAPTAATQADVASFLTRSGLTVVPSGSPFLVRAVGSSTRVSGAFRTTLRTYRDPRGITYFANSTPVWIPSTMAGYTMGVIGLTNTIRDSRQILRPLAAQSGSASCQTPYPSRQELFTAVNTSTPFPYGYGGGPGCSGLTPSQINSIYGAPNVGARGKGAGVTLGLFELSFYQESDIDTWAHQFYGPGYSPPLQNISVDGGSLNPICPTSGDSCPASFQYYAGDIEVDADIEAQLSVAPDAQSLLVYNAPNDELGITELDQYTVMADQDRADVISSSWGVCENDVTPGYAQSENTIFEQMAAQGQSMFGAAGDTGAFDCIRSDGTTIVNVDDPPSQPWVTSVGGTSFEHYNPAANQHPSYPSTEAVWNVDNLCSDAPASSALDGQDGFFWCGQSGAGGGGSSQYWSLPSYQQGPGIINPHTSYGNGSTQCVFAKIGTPCREVPDISANADEYTPYAEYCTGNASTLNSVCATIQTTPSGWFGIGGTSLSSPLWSAIIADRDGYLGARSGNVNPLLYHLYDTDPSAFFHDITAGNNGMFPATPGYDLATGIGTPKMAALITG